MLNFDIYFNDLKVGAVIGGIRQSNKESTCVSGLVTPSLSDQLKAVGITEAYPCALLSNIDIEPQFRRKKFGSMALREFEARAAKLGCHFCYCKVGFTSLEEIDKLSQAEENRLIICAGNDLWSNLRFYMSNGWQPHNHDDFGNRLPDLPDDENWSMAYKAIKESDAHYSLPSGVSIVEHPS
jgi:GNAT superfamily N-acetyltransferase